MKTVFYFYIRDVNQTNHQKNLIMKKIVSLALVSLIAFSVFASPSADTAKKMKMKKHHAKKDTTAKM